MTQITNFNLNSRDPFSPLIWFLAIILFLAIIVPILLFLVFNVTVSMYFFINNVTHCPINDDVISIISSKLFSKPSDDFLAAIVALLFTSLSIAVPIIVSNIANSLKPYKDSEIQKMFIKEPAFKRVLLVIALLAISLFLWFFVGSTFFTGFIFLIFGIYAIIVFCLFLRRSIQYITATDDVVLQDLYSNINKEING